MLWQAHKCRYLSEILILFLLCIFPEVQLWIMIMVFFFLGNSILYSIMNAQIYISTSNVQRFSTSLPTLVISCFLDNSHSNWCEVIFHCGIDLHFHSDKGSKTSFHASVHHIQVLCLFLIGLFCLSFCYWVIWVPCVFWILTC